MSLEWLMVLLSLAVTEEASFKHQSTTDCCR